MVDKNDIVIKHSSQGIIADNRRIEDIVLINDDKSFASFQNSIAEKRIEYYTEPGSSKGKPKVRSVPNPDPWRERKFNSNEHIIVSTLGSIEKITVYEGKYRLQFTSNRYGTNQYFLSVVDKAANEVDFSNLDIYGRKTLSFCEQRAINNNRNVNLDSDSPPNEQI